MTIPLPRLDALSRPSDVCEPAQIVQPLRRVLVPRRRGLYRNGAKRFLDLLLIVLALPMVLPLVLALAIMVASDGGRPFYTQLRVGRGGRPYRMWKLRSMVKDADAQMADYLASNPLAREEWEQTQKLQNDPRITPIGQFLRKSSLDELPQLWNVLIGDMSLVGPRPMMLNQQSLYPGMAYYALRPGITGFWQTAGRNRTSFVARAGYDADYEEALSFRTDAEVLLRTVNVVLSANGC